MRSAILQVLMILPTMLAGCIRQPMVQVKVDDTNQALTADAAKRALLAIDKQEIRPGILVPWPKDEPIQVINLDEISMGIYHCKLKEKTFHAHAFYPKAERHKFNHVSGEFQRNTEGIWVAKVTDWSSGH